MDVKAAMTILKALADGANPFTGEVFPHNSVYQHPSMKATHQGISGVTVFCSSQAMTTV